MFKFFIFYISLNFCILSPAITIADPIESFCFSEAATKYNINKELLIAISRTESSINNTAINQNKTSIDVCHMQINSFWKRELRENWQYLTESPCYCTMVGAWILKQCIMKHGYTWDSVGCYHVGYLTTMKRERADRYISKVKKNLRFSNE